MRIAETSWRLIESNLRASISGLITQNHGRQVVILLSRPVSTYAVVIALATVAIHSFLLSYPDQILPCRRRGHGSDPSEAEVPSFAGPVLLRAGG